MNSVAKSEHITRENILMLLSDDEVASVSNAETTARPVDYGEEYIDMGIWIRAYEVRSGQHHPWAACC